ncbi:hypothetical protein M514_09879 [Trichuris suis]|uniref:Uncharacterized protein n=1 Tax=Trichuris suis TaxID=68888 RepID=A0A085N7Z5_9BILA|nr:hypothetical protein M513_09879 [Trichuris suis]KFD65591.1 hypothetical protein M514_09879 [Trichuris suis]
MGKFGFAMIAKEILTPSSPNGVKSLPDDVPLLPLGPVGFPWLSCGGTISLSHASSPATHNQIHACWNTILVEER